jgi:hypothetical protein
MKMLGESRQCSLKEVAWPQYLKLIGSLQHGLHEILFGPVHIERIVNDPFSRILERQEDIVDVDHSATP